MNCIKYKVPLNHNFQLHGGENPQGAQLCVLPVTSRHLGTFCKLTQQLLISVTTYDKNYVITGYLAWFHKMSNCSSYSLSTNQADLHLQNPKIGTPELFSFVSVLMLKKKYSANLIKFQFKYVHNRLNQIFLDLCSDKSPVFQ